MPEIDINRIQRHQIPVEVFDIWDWEGNTDARAFVAELQDCLDGVPEAYRYAVKLEIDSDWEGRGTLRAYYMRPETDEEWRTRAEREVQWARNKQNSEFQTFLRLKALYEPAKPVAMTAPGTIF